MEQLPDLESLSEEERNLILSVLQRDEEQRLGQQSRASELKQEIHQLRMKSVLRDGDDLSKMCARCKTPFGFFFNTGDVCPVCRFRVCKECRENRIDSQGWLCTLCFKENQLRWLSNQLPTERKEEEDEEGEGKEEGEEGRDTPPLSSSVDDNDRYSGHSFSPANSLSAGGVGRRHKQAVHKPSRSRATTRRLPEEMPKSQSALGASRLPEKDVAEIDSGFSTPESTTGRDSSSSLEMETPVHGGIVGSSSQSRGKCVASSTAEKGEKLSINSAGEHSARVQSSIKVKDTSVDHGKSGGGGKGCFKTSVAESDAVRETKTGDLPESAKEGSKGHTQEGKPHMQDTLNITRQSSGCSFTSSEPGEAAPEEGPSTSGNVAAAPAPSKKDEVDSALGQSLGHVSSDLADTQSDRQTPKPDRQLPSTKSTAEDSETNSLSNSHQASVAGSSNVHFYQQRQKASRTAHNNAAAAAAAARSRSPVQRQTSGFSETYSACSGRTASPGTKIRLLDLASNRALEWEGSDSLQSWSAGSEDTLSLGLSCSGFVANNITAAAAQADVSRGRGHCSKVGGGG